MELMAQHRSVWQESILQFPSRCVPFAVRFQVPRPGCDSPIGLAASDRKTGVGLCHLPLAFTDSGLFRRKARARTVPSPGGVWHSLLPLSALPVTGFGGAVPPASEFGRFRHWRVSGNAHKPLTSKEETDHGQPQTCCRNPYRSPQGCDLAERNRRPHEAQCHLLSSLRRTAKNERGRRALVATTCCFWRKWPIRPTRASSSFSRKKSRRRSSA